MYKKLFSLPIIFLLVFVTGIQAEHLFATPKTINMVALGDSLTFGIGDPLRKGYIERVKEQFEKEKKVAVQLKNFGVPRNRTDQIINQLTTKEVQKAIKRADYVFLFIGTNDFRKSAEYQLEEINEENIRHGKKAFSKKLHHIISEIRKVNDDAPIILLGLYHPYTKLKNQKQLAALIKEWNKEIKKLIPFYNRLYFVPTFDLFQNVNKEAYFHDRLHPNANGYQLIAKRVVHQVLLLEKNVND
jgi:lysophospholipase L1-like esterase